jgi:heat shock protein HslJ
MNLRCFHLAVAPALLAVLTACAAPSGPAPPPLRGTVWQLGADGPQAAHIRLGERELRLVGDDGCKRLMGRFVLDGAQLRFDGIASTRRACLHEDGAEDRFLAALSGVRGWRIDGGVLKMLSASGGTLLDLRPGKATP